MLNSHFKNDIRVQYYDLSKLFIILITVSIYSKHTHNKHFFQNKHFFHNKHTLFALTKLCLFGKEEDFGKINSLYLLNIESFKTHFLYLLKNCVMKNWIWGFLGNFWSSFLGKCTYYEWKLFPLKLSPICFVNTAFQIFSEFEREETGLMATLVAKKASGTCSKILLIFITFTVRKNRSAQTMFKLTPSVPHVPFWDDASLTAFFAHSRYSKFLDPKCLLSLNSISYRMVNSIFFCELSVYCHNYELTWRIALFRKYHSYLDSNQR